MYIDGFNFYYLVVKGTPYKWTDLKELCQAVLRPENRNITAIHYFTARVSDTPSDPNKSIRQQTYLRALKAHIPEFQVHYGHFMRNTKRMPLAANPKKSAHVIQTEEKGSDVNLAVHLLNDAWLDKYDCGVVISNDSDLAQAIKLSRQQGKIVGVVTNRKLPTAKLKAEADFYRRISTSHLKRSALPELIPGTRIRKPSKW